MTEPRWISITPRDTIPPREGRAVLVGGRELAIFNLGDRFLTLENRCPHRGGPLCDGIVAGTAVVCPLHGWKVSLETGEVERPSGGNACVRTYATRVEGEIVWVEIPASTTRAGQAA